MTWTRAGQLSADTQSLVGVTEFAGVSASASALAISNTVAYTGTYSYKQTSNAGYYAWGLSLPTTPTIARANWLFYHDWTPDGSGNCQPIATINVDGAYVMFCAVGSQYIGLWAGYNGGLTTRRYPVDDVASTPIELTAHWYSVGIAANFAASGGFVTLYLDGVPVLSWTGDTQVHRSGDATARTAISGIYGGGGGYVFGTARWRGVAGLNAGNWGTHYIDDFYADAGSGESDAAPPTRRFLVAFPSGAGASTELTANTGDNYAAVDDVPPDDDTTYVKADGSGLRDTYAYADVTVPEDYAVRAVIVAPYARKTDAGVASTLKTVMHSGGDDIVSDEHDLSIGYSYVFDRSEVDPAGDAWTQIGVNNCEFGVESSGAYS